MAEPIDLIVYTNSIGHTYELPKVIPNPKVRYICFSDRPHSQNSDWEICLIKSIFPDDPFRSSRETKILAHKFLPMHEKSLYIDSRVQLVQEPLALWRLLIPRSEVIFGALLNTKRECLVDEFEAVVNKKLDHIATIKSQFLSYKSHHFPLLQKRPVWGGILARRHNDRKCSDAMHIWYSHVLRYSRRDQLSLPVALATLDGEKIHLINESIHRSDYHKWPVGSPTKPNDYFVTEN